MRTRTLLGVVFGVILLCLGLQTIAAFSDFNTLQATFTSLVKADDLTDDALNDVAVIAIDLETAVHGWLVTWRPAFLEPYRRQEPRLRDVLQALVAVEKDDPEGVVIASRLRRKLDVWNQEIAIPLASAGAARLPLSEIIDLNVEGKARMDAVRDDIKQLRDLLGRRRQEHREVVSTFRQRAARDWWILGLVLLAVLSGLGSFLSRQIERPLEALVAYTRQVSETEPGPIVLKRGVREVRVLAEAISSMTKRIAAERAQEQGFTRLVTALSAGGSVASVAAVALRFLLEEHDAVGGVLWIAREGGPPLELAATVMVDRARLLPGGSPLAREMFQTGRAVTMDENRGGAMHVVSAALIDVVPRGLWVAGIRGARAPLGVVELVGIEPLQGVDSSASLTQVGLALENALATERTAGLQREVSAQNEEFQAQNEELQAQEEELRVQGVEVTRQQTELEGRNEALVEASRLKSEFLSSMSHELRTPLNAVIGFADLLLAGNYGELGREQARALHDIESAGHQLLALVNDVLDLAKMEAGRLDIGIATVDVGAAVAEVLPMVTPAAEAKALMVTHDVAVGTYFCAGDHNRVRQILMNLLSNAVKFTPQHGRVGVSVAPGPAGLRVEVTDTGVGISVADQPRLFEPFTQVGAKQSGGTGLGLSISKRLVELMGGVLGFVSTPGKGATFFFTLPERTGREAATPVTLPVGEEPTLPLGPARRASSQAFPAFVSPAEPPPPTEILVVEDDVSTARAIEAVLTREAYRVTIATTGRQALAFLHERPFDLLITDLGLPDMSGSTLVDRVRASESLRDVPLVILTGWDLSEAEEGDLARRVQLVARKGVMTGAGLLDAIADLCGRQRRQRRVLLVDDNELNRRVVGAILVRAGYEIMEATGAEEGLELAFSAGPDVILMDMRMPAMNGIEATAALAADPRTRAIPIVALSAQAMPGDREQALAAGCIAYVTKPVARQELLGALADAVAATASPRWAPPPPPG